MGLAVQRLSIGVALAICAALFLIFKTHYHAVIMLFERAPEMYDMGWFAYLFGRGDLMLMNPPLIDDTSYHGYHLAPLIVLWSAVASGLLGLGGVQSFALFHFAAGVLAFTAFLIVGRGRWLALLIGAAFVAGNRQMFQAMEYPHFEIMFVGLCGVMFASLLRDRIGLAILAAVLLVLMREDGGFYGAYVVLTCMACERNWRRKDHIAVLAACMIAAVLAFWVQGAFFHKPDLFTRNFSGDHWSHLSLYLVADRIWAMFSSVRTGGLLIWAVLVTEIVRRRFTGMTVMSIWAPILLLSPLIGVHLLAVLDPVGRFWLYYALPFATMTLLILLFAVHRIDQMTRKPMEIAAVIALVVMTSILPGEWVGAPGSIARWSKHVFTWPQGQVALYQATIPQDTDEGFAQTCLSHGAMAFSESAYAKAQVYPIMGVDADARYAISPECRDFYVFETEKPAFDGVLVREGFQLQSSVGKLHTFRKLTAASGG